MQQLFVDTAAWASLELVNDQGHPMAIAFKEGPGRLYRWVTTNWVIWETVMLLNHRANHAKAVQFYERARRSFSLELVQITAQHEALAWEIYRRYDDKDFSAVDCTSFAVMKAFHMTTAFTLDTHFRQAGFVVLPAVN